MSVVRRSGRVDQEASHRWSATWRRAPLSGTFANPGARLYGIVLGAGFAGGALGAAYLAALHLLQRALWPTHWALAPHGVILVVVGAAVALITRFGGSPGDVELLVDNIHVSGGAEDLRQLPSLIPVSLLGIAAGGGLGPEAPLVQTTGTIGSWTARRVRLDPGGTRIVTITGMAAGFTVLFGAPLGSALFALEILHRRGLEYYEALMPAVLGSLTGYGVYVLVSGAGIAPVWQLPDVGTVHHRDLVWAIGCGAAGALVATVFTYLNQFLRAAVRRVPPLWRPPLVGGALALLAWLSPYALTFGERQLGHVTAGDLTLGTLAAAAAAKMAGTGVTLAGGWKGGFIIPLFFVGATLGQAGHILFPHANQAVLITATMAACNVGVTKTPLGSVLVVTEMAGITLLPTTLIASVVALLLTSEVALIDSQRRRADAAPLDPASGRSSDGDPA